MIYEVCSKGHVIATVSETLTVIPPGASLTLTVAPDTKLQGRGERVEIWTELSDLLIEHNIEPYKVVIRRVAGSQ